MHMKETLINFLYDKQYFIDIYEEYIHIFNYLELLSLSNTKIILKMPNFNLNIIGNNLFITKLSQDEILIKGSLEKVTFNYEK